MNKPPHLLWMDLETLGLDTRNDPPVEVATLVTTPDLVEVSDTQFHCLIGLDWYGEKRLKANPYVANMHTENGLLEELRTKLCKTMEGAENSILAILGGLGAEPNTVCLAGSGVAAFDMQVLKHWMPSLYKFLNYRTFDVGHIRRFLEYTLDVPLDDFLEKADDHHRAEGDVQNALNQARELRDFLNQAFRKSGSANSSGTWW